MNGLLHTMCVLRTRYPPGLSAGEKESRISPNPCRNCRGKPGEKLRGGTVQERWHKRLSPTQTWPKRSTRDEHTIYLPSSLQSQGKKGPNLYMYILDMHYNHEVQTLSPKYLVCFYLLLLL